MLPIAFKVRGGGNYSGTKGGAVRPNEKGGTGALWYIDKTFTIASTQDQFICAMKPIISPTITTCKGSRGGCSDEALEEIKAVHEARQQQPFTKPNPMTTQPSTPQVPLRFLSVCSGMEAASVAWEPIGWKAVGFSEIEPFPCAVLKHRFPNTPNYGSLTEYQSWPLAIGDVDLLCGGTPCQSYSVAGKRGGLNDPRGQLMLSFLDLAAKLRPRWIVWENVPGVLSSGQPRGADFATFLQGLVDRGYGWAYRVLDAQYFGVPQRRRRVFVVASLGGRDVAASVLLKPESVCWHPAPRRKKGQATAADAGASVEASGLPRTVGTICADTHPGAYTGQDAYTGRLIPAVLQPVCATGNQTHCLTASSGKGATEDGTGRGTPIVIDRAAFNQGENAQYEPHIEQTDVMDSLVARGPHAVGVPFRKSKRAQSTTDDESLVVADASNTLNNFDLGDTRTTHAVVEPVIPIHDQATRFAGKHGNKQDGKGNGLGIGQPGDPMNTLTRGDKHAVYTPPMAVRRLTPRETERLQGFPDDWSKIPWKGKPADQCPDGPRYKCAGNSMAVPVMRWIGEQIARVELSTQQPK